jgi:hypothetical protein
MVEKHRVHAYLEAPGERGGTASDALATSTAGDMVNILIMTLEIAGTKRVSSLDHIHPNSFVRCYGGLV